MSFDNQHQQWTTSFIWQPATPSPAAAPITTMTAHPAVPFAPLPFQQACRIGLHNETHSWAYQNVCPTDIHDWVTILTILGSIFTLVCSIFVISSAVSFSSLRRCVCNWVLIFCAAVNCFADVTNLVMSIRLLATHETVRWKPVCQITGFVAQAAYVTQFILGIYYIAILVMFKKSNERAKRPIRFSLIVCTVAYFIFPSVAMWDSQTGFQPRKDQIMCHLPASGPWSAYSQIRAASMFIPLFLGFCCLCYVLWRTYHMRTASDNNRLAFRMIAFRVSYFAFFILESIAMVVPLEVGEKDSSDPNDYPINGYATMMMSWFGGCQMFIFAYQEGLISRWKCRIWGPSGDRMNELSRIADTKSFGSRSSLTIDAVPQRSDEEELAMLVALERQDPYIQKPLSKVLNDMGDGKAESVKPPAPGIVARKGYVVALPPSQAALISPRRQRNDSSSTQKMGSELSTRSIMMPTDSSDNITEMAPAATHQDEEHSSAFHHSSLGSDPRYTAPSVLSSTCEVSRPRPGGNRVSFASTTDTSSGSNRGSKEGMVLPPRRPYSTSTTSTAASSDTFTRSIELPTTTSSASAPAFGYEGTQDSRSEDVSAPINPVRDSVPPPTRGDHSLNSEPSRTPVAVKNSTSAERPPRSEEDYFPDDTNIIR